jgi:hypothetical protein
MRRLLEKVWWQMSITNFLTATCTHKNNPTGAASLSTVQGSIACSPLDPVSSTPGTDYPVEKLFLLREFFTKYTAFANGDYATFGSTDYPVRAVHPWGEQGGLDDFYRIVVEAPYGS